MESTTTSGISPWQEFGVFLGPIQKHTGVFHNENGVFIPWTTLCTAGQSYLLQSCSSLIDSGGTLTTAGDTAVGCITNGAIISALAASINVPLDTIKSILGPLARLTGCGGIVNMNQIQNSPDVQRLLHIAGSMAQLNSTSITSNSSSTNFLTYSNSTYGIKIQYPSSWLKEESHNQSSNDIVKFSSPAGTAPASLNIIGGKPVPQSIPLQVYINASLYVLRKSFDNFSLIESNITTLGGFPAYKIVYTGIIPSSGLELKLMQILTIKDGKNLVITFGTLPIDFSTYQPTIRKMIDSFAFIPVTTPATAQSVNATSTPTPPLIAKPNQNTSSVPAVPVPAAQSISKNNTYTNSTDGISLTIPQGWSTEEGQNKANDTLLTVVALSPSISLNPNALMQIVVQKDTRPSTSSIGQYLRDELTSYRSNPPNNFIDYYGAAGLFPKFLPQAQQIVKSLVVQP